MLFSTIILSTMVFLQGAFAAPTVRGAQVDPVEWSDISINFDLAGNSLQKAESTLWIIHGDPNPEQIDVRLSLSLSLYRRYHLDTSYGQSSVNYLAETVSYLQSITPRIKITQPLDEDYERIIASLFREKVYPFLLFVL